MGLGQQGWQEELGHHVQQSGAQAMVVGPGVAKSLGQQGIKRSCNRVLKGIMTTVATDE